MQLYILQSLTYPILAIMHLPWFTCDYLLAMANKNNSCTMLSKVSLESLWNLEKNSENRMKIG